MGTWHTKQMLFFYSDWEIIRYNMVALHRFVSSSAGADTEQITDQRVEPCCQEVTLGHLSTKAGKSTGTAATFFYWNMRPNSHLRCCMNHIIWLHVCFDSVKITGGLSLCFFLHSSRATLLSCNFSISWLWDSCLEDCRRHSVKDLYFSHRNVCIIIKQDGFQRNSLEEKPSKYFFIFDLLSKLHSSYS